jgi:rod shape-determining protein MreC
MESFFSRYKNVLVLVGVLFVQVIILASNVERDNPRAASHGRTSLVRVWTMNTISPLERGLVSTGHFFRDTWRNYIDLHDVRRQNHQLQSEVDRLRLEQARWKEDISESQRLKSLLDFKERFVGRTVAAQVIGTSGSEQSRVVTIDKGAQAGLKPDMAVITPDGIVGKVKEVYRYSSHVLLVTDHESGAGVVLEKSRLRGILHGTGPINLVVNHIMADEKVDPGENVVTSGGDGIYPRGLPVGTVISSAPDPNPDNSSFLVINIKPAADLARLEDVLVVTEIAEQSPAVPDASARVRAADILSERLPSVPKSKSETPEDAAKNKTMTSGAVVAPPGTFASAGPGRKPTIPQALKGGSPVNALTGKPGTPQGGSTTLKTPAQKKKTVSTESPAKKTPSDEPRPPTEAPPQ